MPKDLGARTEQTPQHLHLPQDPRTCTMTSLTAAIAFTPRVVSSWNQGGARQALRSQAVRRAPGICRASHLDSFENELFEKASAESAKGPWRADTYWEGYKEFHDIKLKAESECRLDGQCSNLNRLEEIVRHARGEDGLTFLQRAAAVHLDKLASEVTVEEEEHFFEAFMTLDDASGGQVVDAELFREFPWFADEQAVHELPKGEGQSDIPHWLQDHAIGGEDHF